MGHEYMEMKNTSAAIASYRQAVGKVSHNCRLFYDSVSLIHRSQGSMF